MTEQKLLPDGVHGVAVQPPASSKETVTKKEPEMERDTDESAEMSVSDVWQKVLLPSSLVATGPASEASSSSAGFQQQVLSFSAGYDQRLFDGWTKQPSPCCGAASIAGAHNALKNLHRFDARAKNFRDLTDVLAKYCAGLARGRRKRLERMLEGWAGNCLEV